MQGYLKWTDHLESSAATADKQEVASNKTEHYQRKPAQYVRAAYSAILVIFHLSLFSTALVLLMNTEASQKIILVYLKFLRWALSAFVFKSKQKRLDLHILMKLIAFLCSLALVMHRGSVSCSNITTHLYAVSCIHICTYGREF